MEDGWRNSLTEAFIKRGLRVEFEGGQKHNVAATVEGIGSEQLVEDFLVSLTIGVGWVVPPRLQEGAAPSAVPHDDGACIC
eukprot:CAMPEP_0118954340 /NCGR_PEP_ID=MMETSP1169-20130426/58096_1 /TAXON_ID=36882 /ORGANISM="Pyramimonas obovata, Strain CCMP722" /LENGTH=80 /DNA_ID=CAMNT_0006901959 /DNA_START=191 /DNA_END=433 /DNA_ORIENTATION=+